MQIQKSFKQELACLYLVATPIGNLGDMTPRCIEVLKSVDLIAAEDTRHTKKLCHVFEIETPLTSYHEHNKDSKGDYIIELLSEGKNIALVSDAGLPCISDPGYEVVAAAIEAGYAVIPVPGANAALSALINCFRFSATTIFILRILKPCEIEEEKRVRRFKISTVHNDLL